MWLNKIFAIYMYLLLKHSVLVHVEHKILWPMASGTAEPIQKPLEQGCM